MKKLMITSMLAALCASGTAKADENRLNLWPLVGYEDGALDVIWPLGHFKDADEWRFFPIIKEHDLFGVFPELWFSHEGFAILPLVTEYDFGCGTLFPVLWWDLKGSDKTHSVFPLYYYHGRDRATTFWAGCGLAGYNRHGDAADHWILPLYAKGERNFYSIPYSRTYTGNERTEAFLCGLAGRTALPDGQILDHWCLPFYYKDKKSLASLPLCLDWNEAGELDSWFSLPLLSGGGQKDNAWREFYLLGLGGATWNGKDGKRSSWAFPFYYEDNQGTFSTLLGGKKNDARWILPLFYTDTDQFVSLPYITSRDEYNKKTTYVIPPLLAGCTKYDDGAIDTSALILYGHGTDAKGQTKHDYLLPLYYYNGKNGDFGSVLFGRDTQGSYTNSWWATPLVGTRSGSKTGGWFFPLFNRTKDASFDKDLARLDSPTIPDDIQFSQKVDSWRDSKGVDHAYTNFTASVGVSSSVNGSVLLGSDHDQSVWGYLGDKDYALTYTSKQGNRILFNNEATRRVTYDKKTRQRANERVDSETMALCGLFYRTHESNAQKGTSHTRTRVLWKLWDHEETDGNVTLDAFPGFTHDSKTNGYSKTSFLWRFFRYENDSAAGKKVDLFFIPVWR